MNHQKVNCKNCEKEFYKKNSEIRKSKTGNHFCSQSCSATYTNKIKPKRQVEGECKLCNKPITKTKTYCELCYPIFLESRKKEFNKCLDCGIKIKRHNKRCINCHKLNFKYNKKHYKDSGVCVDCNGKCSYVSKRCIECHDKYRKDPETYDMTLNEAIYSRLHKSSAFALIRNRARTIAKNLGWNCCKFCGYSKHIEICHIKPISSFDENVMVSEINDPSNLMPLCPNCHWEFDHGLLDEPPTQ